MKQTPPLTIYCNARFSDGATQLLRDGVAPHRLVSSPSMLQSNLTVPAQEPDAREADVVFGQPHPDDLIQSPRVRWVHLHSAGYTRYDRDDVRRALRARGAVLTNSSSVFDDACAQHVLAFMLAWSRRLPDAMLAQVPAHEWAYQRLRREVRVLTGETAMLFGFGAIARRLVELLAPFRMNLIGVRRKVRGDEPVRTVTTEQADRELPTADHVINVLPASPHSIGYFSRDRLSRFKPAAAFYNIGRGDTVDQAALVDALNANHLAAAYLDVTTPEPLPPTAALWSATNCYITPHIAGGHQDEQRHLVRHFLENLRRFERGQQLADRVV